MNQLGERVRRARNAAGISQRELAIRARTSQGAISRIENGLEEPGWDRFAQIMRGMGYAPRVDLQPLAVPDAEPGQLLEHAHKTPQSRFEEGVNWSRFLRRLTPASADDG